MALQGSLDTATSPELHQELLQRLTKDVRIVVFDLAGLEFLSSAGMQVFISVKQAMRDRGGNVLMVNMQPQIQKVFEIIKAAMGGFLVFGSVKELDEYLAKIQADHLAK
jgi:anti-anti-sigma factor